MRLSLHGRCDRRPGETVVQIAAVTSFTMQTSPCTQGAVGSLTPTEIVNRINNKSASREMGCGLCCGWIESTKNINFLIVE